MRSRRKVSRPSGSHELALTLYNVAIAQTDPWKTLPSFRHQWNLLDLAIRYIQTRLALATPASTPAPSDTNSPNPSTNSSTHTFNFTSIPASTSFLATPEFGDLTYSNPPTSRSARMLVSPDPMSTPTTKEDYLGQVPDLFLIECALLKTAERIAVSSAPLVAAGKEEEALHGVLERLEVRRIARLRWLRSLRWLGASMDDVGD